ncbi:MAG: type II toxin-antitoxin system VapB family antitoxin [Mobilicoccus sp.]|nr:type II toxin-antitoxin system VapB family antitoxin [Mobilicoccus sp.]
MTRTDIDLDDELVAAVMARYGISTKEDAVDFALRRVAGPVPSRAEMLEMEGSGWHGDLADLRGDSPAS